jgi:hypothetical protein
MKKQYPNTFLVGVQNSTMIPLERNLATCIKIINAFAFSPLISLPGSYFIDI